MHGIKKYIILLIFGSAAFVALFLYLGYKEFNQPNSTQKQSVIIIPTGQGLIRTSRLLYQQKIITNKDVFKGGVMLMGQQRNLKAGEFLIPAGSSMQNILDILVKGEVIQHKLTIVEGWTSWQVAQYLNSLENLTDKIEALPIEGSIMPESYLYTHGTSRYDILMRMQQKQQDLLEILWRGRAANLPIQNIDQAVILASIVERETAVPEERGHIAGVFINRLNKNMRLQSDPTIIYGIDRKGFLDRGLKKSEIGDKENPYNTYQIKSLPPTAIGHPGHASIEAVLNPMATEDIYFVADGTGKHVFSKTLAQHNKNVTKWRKIESNRK